MAKFFPKSQLPIRKSSDLLPKVFQTDANDKFLSGVLDPLLQPGTLEKNVGYVGRRYGKTYNGSDIYLDTDATLRSRYQLEPGVVLKKDGKTQNFYDFIDFKNILKYFGNNEDRDDLIDQHQHYSWNPPVDWDKFINYREYFWMPSGPPPIRILGQSSSVISTYRVKLGEASSFIFSPDGYTNNPRITLYRGQKYKFIVNVPGNGFVIRTSYDTGSLTFNPDLFYPQGSIVVFNGSVWKAKVPVSPADGSTITTESQDWEFVEIVNANSAALDYTKGITNFGIENGTLTFDVPYDAPDILYYQSITDPNKFGQFIISDIEENSKININDDIIGKTTYTSSNGIELSNGMIVNFGGVVTPEKYSKGNWLVEGVGKAISLTNFDDLVVPVLTSDVPEVLFDNEGFDTAPFDDASSYPGTKDYITIAKSSKDLNPWSRYNRWFHRSVLELSFKLSGEDFYHDEAARAKRPIIEFLPNLKLYEHGVFAKETVDYIDTFTSDVFSKIEGSTGYSIDGEPLFNGARILVTADTDSLANNKIYQVKFFTQNGQNQITLIKVDDTESIIGETLLVRRGKKNKGTMFYYDGTAWLSSQEKTKVNQAPLFDAFDENGVSFSDKDTYPVSTFRGTKILAYKESTGVVDLELGFPISYLNISNVGDISFEFVWDIESFTYEVLRKSYSKNINTGFCKFNLTDEYVNHWIETEQKYLQPIIDSQVITTATDTVYFNTVDWFKVTDQDEIYFYKNGERYTESYTRQGGNFIFATPFAVKDVLVIKIFCNLIPEEGYYEIPVGLEKNPLNNELTDFTFGQAVDHISSGLEFYNGFSGLVVGNNSLRDIHGFQAYTKRFLKHESVAPVALTLLVDKQVNLIKALRYAKKSYTDFKHNFIKISGELDFDGDIPKLVDNIINELTRGKNPSSPFVNSDMIGSGAYTNLIYEVEDPDINTFVISDKFDLKTLSNRAVYLYINNQQLINGFDYEFNSDFSFVNILKTLNVGDILEIREYVSSGFNHIPQTPTKIGLFKKFVPEKFLDDTFVEPKYMIQGHDGSLTTAFNDYRDDALLELELRIFNNIKKEYDENIFDIDATAGGYYKTGIFEYNQIIQINTQEFLKWIADTNIDYVSNSYFDSENSFTYTYSNMSDPAGLENLPGWWRGVYKYFYDTDRPHRCPWEMLGFSIKPTWWESEYGPAPYTRNNLLLWEDLAAGLIRQGPRAGVHKRYVRSTLLTHIPVDGDGKLLSPLDSNLAQNFSLINNQGDFNFGDISPAEHAWYSSSEYPFATIIGMALLRPFEFVGKNFDNSKIVRNKLNQLVHTDTGIFVKVEDLVGSSSGGYLTSGLVSYIVDYLKSHNINENVLQEKLDEIDVYLTHRLSGFVDQTQQRFILDSKNPNSTSANIFVPVENQEIYYNVSAPIASIIYSAVIVEKMTNGWKISGYDFLDPHFTYFAPVISQIDPLISVGGVSENFVNWTEDKFYGNGVVARYNNEYYRSVKSHQSGSTFDLTLWKKLPDLPKKDDVQAFKRRTFNTIREQKISYGTTIGTIQGVVDFLLGYEQYLISKGFKFDRYDTDSKVTQDWFTSAKEFMYWTQHNWAPGSLLTLSPAAEKMDVSYPIGVPDNLLDSFYEYQVFRGDGQPLTPNFLNIKRDFQNITIETTNTAEGIYFFKAHLVLKEHVAIFDDRTVFNDVIYDKTTGYRQERVKARGFRTVDWDGDYTSPGFLFDNVNIIAWQPYTDYRLGDIVNYKSYNWVTKSNHTSTDQFVNAFWTKLDSTPNKRLVPNFDYRINQFEDYYNLDADGLGSSQRDLGRHAIGYQTREYLQNLAEDDVTQFQLYQGFIREKGTLNAAVKIFDKLSKTTEDSIVLNEEWAFNVGTLGGVDELNEVEFAFNKDSLQVNPQPMIFVSSAYTGVILDQYLRIPASDFTNAPSPFTTSIIPKTDFDQFQSAGYVKLDQVDFVIKNRSDLETLDITQVKDGDHFWITFDNSAWTVLRFTRKPLLTLISAIKTGTTIEITFNRRHAFIVDDYIGINDVPNLTGFYKINEVTLTSVIIACASDAKDPLVDTSTLIRVYGLDNVRFSSGSDIDQEYVALLPNNSKLWFDSNDNGLWEVVQKNKVFSYKSLTDYGTTVPEGTGHAVCYVERLQQTITSMPSNSMVLVYVEGPTGLKIKQTFAPEPELYLLLSNSFGEELAVSPDGHFLAVGCPRASGVPSAYIGVFDPTANYEIGDVVEYAGKLWKATTAVVGDGSTIDIQSNDWEPTSLLTYDPNFGRGEGFRNQGAVSIYVWNNQNWSLTTTLVSPRPAFDENFGSNISISKSGSDYWMAVSAPGSLDSRGRIYLYRYNSETLAWEQHENNNYIGVYVSDPARQYPKGSIVWWNNSYWKAVEDTNGDGSTISISSPDWIKIDDISSQSSLPTNVSIEDDGSTISSGLLSESDLAELTKQGDMFGSAMAMNKDGSILVVGVADSDGIYFANYKGIWSATQEYIAGDVVKYQGYYHRLTNVRPEDPVDSATYRSFGEYPDDGLPWTNVGDSTIPYSTGKVYIYQRDSNSVYKLKQTITAGSIGLFDDTGNNESITVGDKFGFSVDVDATGQHIVISAPQADINLQNQGAVYYFSATSLTNPEWRLKQKLESFEEYNNLLFGSDVSISSGTERIVVGAKNAPYKSYAYFETGTTFDKNSTIFSTFNGYSGQVYSFERVSGKYFLTEKLEADVTNNESFGYAIDATSDVIVVGSPNYNNGDGLVRTFRKDTSVKSLKTLAVQEQLIDISKIKNISLIDADKNVKISDIDFIDPIKLKILGLAEQELNFKTPYDPAIYTNGTEETVVDPDAAWFTKNVGKLWWNLNTAKWLYYEQGDIAYRNGNWGQLAKGSTIDVYEWVETTLLPSEWSALADTTAGLTEGISGQPLYPNDDVYSVKQFYNEITQQVTEIKYYYWVKGSTVVPQKVNRKLSAGEVAALIETPISSGYPILALLDSDKILAYNFNKFVTSGRALLNIEFYTNESSVNPVHREYVLLAEGVADNLPPETLETKWIDSLVGFDQAGNTVPDPKLSTKEKYGLSFRPRQSMFVNRSEILKIVITNINSLLLTNPYSEILNFDNLNSTDLEPDEKLNEYDVAVDTITDLEQIGAIRVRQAVLQANIVNGEVDTIDIVDSGFGYKNAPYIEIQGDGTGARAYITIDNQGRVSSVKIQTTGRKYTTATVKIREYSVLVRTDETINNFWSIYSWDQQRRIFYKSKSQGYDVRNYWSYIDWWKPGYSTSTRILYEVPSLYLEPTIYTEPGDLIRVKEYANGGWAVLERTADGSGEILGKYLLVARQNGTIEFKDSLYNTKTTAIGFDNVGYYDTALYDLEPSRELRIILNSIKTDLFVGDLKVEWNKLFFTCVRYAFSENQPIFWAFKTSFINALHNVGSLEHKVSYKNDNLPAYQKYLEEIKPYKTSIREYTSRYVNQESTNTDILDFDLPPVYSTRDNKIVPVNNGYNLFDQYPWKWWYDNKGFSVVSIEVSYAGADYTSVPTVLIEGNGTGAKAKAYISNGKVSGITMVDIGEGYTETPTITLVGGNGSSLLKAKAIAILGQTKARTFNLGIKFDRISKEGIYNAFTHSQTFTASGRTAVFDLAFAPTRDKSKITIVKNKQLILNNEYSLSLFKTSTDDYKILKGRLIFVDPPAKDDVITITYEKNDELLDAVNRINKYYSPTSGMIGNEVGQLMTGIDFGGVQVQGTTFDVTGGWDALPWFTDSWDSVDSNDDYYVIVDGSTSGIELPEAPVENQIITIYLQRAGTSKPIRIDDPHFDHAGDSALVTNSNALMPTFVGDGSTKIVSIENYFQTYAGDVLIFRPAESDGSVNITDTNLLDSKISGGTLASMSGAYSTATGMTAEEIVISGGAFNTPDHTPAPEENVPGQILDSVSIKVFQTTISGAATIQNKVVISDGITSRYAIDLTIIEEASILVYVDKISYVSFGDSTTSYSIDFTTNEIVFNTPPALGSTIEIIAIGRGGIALLDFQEFVADGNTRLFLTKADYSLTQNILVTVDGHQVDTGFTNSTIVAEDTGTTIEPGKTMVEFGLTPDANSIIKIICLGSTSNVDSSGLSVIRVNKQILTYEGSTRSFMLDKFVDPSRSSAIASMVVLLNNKKLKGPDTYYRIYDGSNNEVEVGVDPTSVVTSVDVRVYINNILQPFVTAYIYDGTTGTVVVNTEYLELQDVIRIEIINNAEYSVTDNILQISDLVTLVDEDQIEVTWFSEYPTFDIVSDVHSGGKVQYQLNRAPLDSHYVWVYKNGERLVQGKEFVVSTPRNVVYLNIPSLLTDKIEIMEFGNNVYKTPRAFEMYKDMFNVTHYKRYAINDVQLSKELNYYDTTIEVNDASALDEPNMSKNIPGVVTINKERIEFLTKSGNVLGQLRRGTLGSSIGQTYPAGTPVISAGVDDIIPYIDSQEKEEFVSDGSTLLIGPLSFVPTKSTRSSFTRKTIPEDFGACDQVEIFVAGKRLRKDQLSVYNESLGSVSPSADEILEAEFSVDGATPYIRLTKPATEGTRILIIRKVGRLWYERAETTASRGITLLDNNTAIARFIDQKPTELP